MKLIIILMLLSCVGCVSAGKYNMLKTDRNACILMLQKHDEYCTTQTNILLKDIQYKNERLHKFNQLNADDTLRGEINDFVQDCTHCH